MQLEKQPKKQNIVRSSAAEYLTFVVATGDNPDSVEVRYEDENIWLTQKMMAVLYDVSLSTINEHLKKIFADSELDENSVIRKFRITASDGKAYNTNHYNLQAIIAVGFKVNNQRAVRFRVWANQIVKDYTIQGWAMDVERLKFGGSILNEEYFGRQLERIREIRLSERKFYQKITDIYATSLDYDKSAKTTHDFFATVQNKLHWAIHGQTAAELVYYRADSKKERMGLTYWEDMPGGKIKKSDVTIAKNYLSEQESSSLEHIVMGYLEFAEDMSNRRIPMTMEDWSRHLDLILQASKYDLLNNPGKITAELAKRHAETEFEKYRIVQDELFKSDYDSYLEELENKLAEIKDVDVIHGNN